MLAVRLALAAEVLAGVNDERVVFVEKGSVIRKAAFE